MTAAAKTEARPTHCPLPDGGGCSAGACRQPRTECAFSAILQLKTRRHVVQVVRPKCSSRCRLRERGLPNDLWHVSQRSAWYCASQRGGRPRPAHPPAGNGRRYTQWQRQRARTGRGRPPPEHRTPGAARRGASRHGTARHGTARHGTARHGTVRPRESTSGHTAAHTPNTKAADEAHVLHRNQCRHYLSTCLAMLQLCICQAISLGTTSQRTNSGFRNPAPPAVLAPHSNKAYHSSRNR